MCVCEAAREWREAARVSGGRGESDVSNMV